MADPQAEPVADPQVDPPSDPADEEARLQARILVEVRVHILAIEERERTLGRHQEALLAMTRDARDMVTQTRVVAADLLLHTSCQFPALFVAEGQMWTLRSVLNEAIQANGGKQGRGLRAQIRQLQEQNYYRRGQRFPNRHN